MGLESKKGPGLFLVDPGDESWQVELQEQQKLASLWRDGRRRARRRGGEPRLVMRPRFMFLDPEATPEQVEWLVLRFREEAIAQIQ